MTEIYYEVLWKDASLGFEDIWLHNNGRRNKFKDLVEAETFTKSKQYKNKPFYWQPVLLERTKEYCNECGHLRKENHTEIHVQSGDEK